MKTFILAIISLILFSNILSCSTSELRNFAFEVTAPGQAKKRFSFKYDDLHINHQLLKEQPQIEATFKFIWNYKDEAEKLKGKQVAEDMHKLIKDVNDDGHGLV